MPAVYEGLGLEPLTDLVEYVLRDKFSAALAVQQAKGEDHDLDRWVVLGNDPDDFTPLVLDPVPQANFHVGVLPSFVQSHDREQDYPLVAVVPGRIAPDPEDLVMDQMGVVNNYVTIHVFAKAVDPTLSYRKALRMAEAVYQILTGDPRIAKKVQRKTPNNVMFSEPWHFYANGEDHGPELWWFAVGTEFQIKNYIKPPGVV